MTLLRLPKLCDLKPFSPFTLTAESQKTEGSAPRLQTLLGGRDETCFTVTKMHLSCVKEQTRTRMKAPLYAQVPRRRLRTVGGTGAVVRQVA